SAGRQRSGTGPLRKKAEVYRPSFILRPPPKGCGIFLRKTDRIRCTDCSTLHTCPRGLCPTRRKALAAPPPASGKGVSPEPGREIAPIFRPVFFAFFRPFRTNSKSGSRDISFLIDDNIGGDRAERLTAGWAGAILHLQPAAKVPTQSHDPLRPAPCGGSGGPTRGGANLRRRED